MRLFWIGVPAGLALACGGLLLNNLATGAHVETVAFADATPIHPVTTAMEAETAARAKHIAPALELKDVAGKTVTIGYPGSPRPQFVYFVLDGCPCSFTAEPIFQSLYKHFGGKVDFLTVTNADDKNAKDWWHRMTVPYSVISDPKVDVMKAYGATNAVFSVLITRDGHIAKMWPGYSVDILKEMNRDISKAAGIPETRFDPLYAPKEKTSGCAFYLGG